VCTYFVSFSRGRGGRKRRGLRFRRENTTGGNNQTKRIFPSVTMKWRPIPHQSDKQGGVKEKKNEIQGESKKLKVITSGEDKQKLLSTYSATALGGAMGGMTVNALITGIPPLEGRTEGP